MRDSLFDKTLKIVLESGEILKNINEEKEASIKSDGTIVTKYDLLIEKTITDKLRELGDYKIFSEEHFFEQNMSEKNKTYFMIDPLDGTHNFNAGYDCFGMIIAYVENSITLFSIIYFPLLNKTYIAKKDEGSYLNGKRIYVKNYINKVMGFCIVSKESLENIIEIVNNSINIELRSLACTAAEICLLAEGVFDFYFSKNKCSLWDLVGTQLIIEEAGGILKYEKSEDDGKYNVIAGTREAVHLIENITKIL